MALFAVTYDLNRKKDYPKLWDELDRLGGHKAAFSFYFLELDNTADEVRDHFAEYVDGDDRIIVVEFSKRPETRKAFKGTRAWLDAHLD